MKIGKKKGWSNVGLSIYTKTVPYHVADVQKMSYGGCEKQLKLPKPKKMDNQNNE